MLVIADVIICGNQYKTRLIDYYVTAKLVRKHSIAHSFSECYKRLDTLDNNITGLSSVHGERVALGFDQRLDTFTDVMIRHNTAQAAKTADLERKLEAYHEKLVFENANTHATLATQAEIIADLNLELKTTKTY